MNMQKTPNANRLHIGLFGKVNSGKSTLLNALVKQDVAIISNQPGTTTDPIYKAMEVPNLGPVVWMDTAGFDDPTSLQNQRLLKTKEVLIKSDIAIMVLSTLPEEIEIEWLNELRKQAIPYLLVYNHQAKAPCVQTFIEKEVQEQVIKIDAQKQEGIPAIFSALLRKVPIDYQDQSITGSLCHALDVVLLVMPQDIQAPKGRLILPQVQTIRELLDKQCIVVSCNEETYQATLASLVSPPHLIICDSQVFKHVYQYKPKLSMLTSFSILFAHYKGDITIFKQGANALASLQPHHRVLIAEACTHAPVGEDIGRVKIPALLRKRYGETLNIDVVSGQDFPQDLSSYHIIIHCGACMFHRKYVVERMKQAQLANVPITNYGVCLAYLQGILEDVVTSEDTL